MQTVSRSNFTTVKTEGAILPADLLQRIADGDLDGLQPESYHLASNERPNEAINRAWNRCLGVWRAFNEQRRDLPATDTGTSLTRERWLLILFQELGYGRLSFQRRIELPDGTAYPISHMWERTPIHLISFQQALDHRDPTIKRSPHSLMQEFLNRTDDSLWGFVSNGLALRVLRDNASLTRAAYLEFDLEMMMAGEIYADFSLLWLVCHQSRVEIGSQPDAPALPSNCWLEKWSQEAAELGTRALDALRDGVQEAIGALGRGFLAHPANGELRQKLSSGELSTLSYYRQLLRLVYRLIFLFVAEDRDLLLVPEAEAEGNRELGIGNREKDSSPTPAIIRQRYMDHYSLNRLRRLAEGRRGGPHPDLYRTLRRVCWLLRQGYEPLGLPALGSFLFSERSTPALDEADLANTDLLNAIRALAFTIEGQVLRPVDYKNLGSEELGSVYESLLELHPQLNIAAATFELATAAGSERKTTGSYYTPSSLINSLLDTALEPVVEARLAAARNQGNRELGVGNREKDSSPTPHSQLPTPQPEEHDEQQTHSVLSRPERLAGEHEPGREVLLSDQELSQGGTVRDDLSDPAGSGLDSGQHRRGQRPGKPGRVHPVSSHRPGLTQRVGDSPDSLGTGEPGDSPSRQAGPGSVRDSRQDAESLNPISSEEGGREKGNRELGIGNREEGNRELGIGNREKESSPTPHSPLPTPRSSTPPSSLEEAILSIRVVDPAAGSGHFLIAAANRLATHLARIRTGDDEPSPAARRDALRDVVRRCIHGVDINEMAVELCKVALWMETLDPGKPLSFLEANIQCGNSLIGTTPALLKKGIPDEAFSPITGDDRDYCSEWKRRNKQEREGQLAMTLDPQPWERLGDLAAAMAALDRMEGDTLAGVQAQESRYSELVRSTPYLYSRFWADAWCAAFVWPKKPEHQGGYAYPITEAVFRQIEHNPHDVASWMKEEVERLRDEYQFFHWHLAFPDVFTVPSKGEGADNEQAGWNGGFDVVLGNPPWERIKLQEREWFAARDPEVANASNAAARRKMITALIKENPALHAAFLEDKRKAEGESHIVRDSERYPLCGRGDVNTYTIFAELSRNIRSITGRSGIIVPSGIATDDTTKFFFGDITEKDELRSLYDFQSGPGLFGEIGHARFKFCLLTLGHRNNKEEPGAEFAFFLRSVGHLSEQERRFKLDVNEITLLNPNTRTCPIFRSKRDAELAKAVYRRVPVLIREGPREDNPWGIRFFAMFHMSNDSGLFRTHRQLEEENWQLHGNQFVCRNGIYLPLYEAKMFYYFTHRYGDYSDYPEDAQTSHLPDIPPERLSNPNYVVLPRYWVQADEVRSRLSFRNNDWMIVFRAISNPTNERTFISTVLPLVGMGNSGICCEFTKVTAPLVSAFLANASSFAFDWTVRQKMGGVNMNMFVVKQLALFSPRYYEVVCEWESNQKLLGWILPRILELTYTAWDLYSFARDCGYFGPPFRWDEERRFLLRCELDAAYFHLYGIERDDVDYIMETFPIVKRKDEAAHGEYRTKRVILEIYDELAEAIKTGRPYQARLDPPPADARVAHPWDSAYGEPPDEQGLWNWEEGNRELGIGSREKDSSPTPYSPLPTPDPEELVLRHPEVPKDKKPKQQKPTRVAQETFLDVMPAPAGPRATRLKRAMALREDPSPIATRELVAFMADEDDNIRWLAGSSLTHRGDADTVAAIAAFLAQAEPERVALMRAEALRILRLLAETADEEAVRQAAGEALSAIED